eukprot:Colp12_sorted_trinity150504_noHs@6765
MQMSSLGRIRSRDLARQFQHVHHQQRSVSTEPKTATRKWPNNGLVSVAPMMAITNTHFRYMMRLLTRHTLLYTEMINAKAIKFNTQGRDKMLRFHAVEHPIAVQIGGADPEEIQEAARICVDYGYDEINLNVGCPSHKVAGSGLFGAALMKEAGQVARIAEYTIRGLPKNVPFTIKCRIGVDEFDSYEFLQSFIRTVADAGVTHFAVHARKAWLKGMLCSLFVP